MKPSTPTIPRLTKTFEPALATATSKPSKSRAATLNVRLALPRRSMFIAADGHVAALPKSQDANTGLVLTQIPFSLN